MKKILGTLVFLLSTGAMAGHKTGNTMPTEHPNNNGGGGMVCRNLDDSIRSVQLLDFWEYKNLENRSLWENDYYSVKKQIERAFDNLPPTPFYRRARAKALSLNKREGQLPLAANVAIAPPSDARNRFIERGCKLEGIAFYDDEVQKFYLDETLYALMNPTHQAGLWVHEAIYRELRQSYSVNDSRAARRITACAFGDTVCPELIVGGGVPRKGPVYICKSSLSSVNAGDFYWAFPDSDTTVETGRFNFEVMTLANGVIPPMRFVFKLYGLDIPHSAPDAFFTLRTKEPQYTYGATDLKNSPDPAARNLIPRSMNVTVDKKSNLLFDDSEVFCALMR